MATPYDNYRVIGCGYDTTPDSAIGKEDYLNTYGPSHLLMANAIDDSDLFRKVCDIFDLLESGGIGPGGGSTRVMLSAIRRGVLFPLAVDLRREDRAPTNLTPFPVPQDFRITDVVMRNTAATADFDIDILESTDGGVIYTSIFNKNFSPGTNYDRTSGLVIDVTQDTLLRIRYSRNNAQGNTVTNLQINVLAQFT